MSSRPPPSGDDLTATVSRGGPSPARPASDEERVRPLKPGDLVLQRYRIVSKLGSGGMGDVYRADDLTLGSPVALKFLPDALATHPGRLERFRAEVRVSRQVSHPNVCRVFDIAEDTGRVFLSMEYIDGEDLASLLRRIGRLPHDKAVELARQICFGLHAAHDKGLVHRDMKPANIMIDGRGNARVTDFGISGIAEDLVAKGDVAAGTPAYMAPEQLAGQDVSRRSDIYSLGLVLYELFTGRPAYQAESLAQLRDLRLSSSRPTSPSAFVKDLDPAVERVILHCLEPEASDRPTSAIAVAAALPGGDPLAAALAAGELPSPELVAAAGPSLGLPFKWAIAAVAAFVVLIGAMWFGYEHATINGLRPFNDSPEVMRAKARDILHQLGRDTEGEHWASGFGYRRGLKRELRALKLSPQEQREWLRTGPVSPVWFWYASSSEPLRTSAMNVNYVMSVDDLNLIDGATAMLIMEPSGRLLQYARHVGYDRSDESDKPVDWSRLFSLAGLDMKDFETSKPPSFSEVSSDAMFGWVENGAAAGDNPLGRRIVTAASLTGRPVYFQVTWPYSLKPPDSLPSRPWYMDAADVSMQALLGISAVGVLVLAAYQVRKGRADVRSAFRLAFVVFLLHWLGGVFSAERFVSIFDKQVVINQLVPGALYSAAFLWVYYLSLEPVMRRARPQLMVSWSRAMSGRWNDPLVARDVVLGVLGGTLLCVCALGAKVIDGAIGGPTSLAISRLEPFRNVVSTLAQAASTMPNSISIALFLCVLLALATLVLKRSWLATGVVFLVTMLFPAASTETLLGIIVSGLGVAASTVIMVRVGVLGLVVVACTFYILDVPYTTDVNNWMFPQTLVSPLLMAAVMAWGVATTTRRSGSTRVGAGSRA